MPPPQQPYLAFVAAEESNTVAVVNLATFRLTASIAVPPRPVQLVRSPRARELYVLSASGKVSVISYPDLRVAATVPVGRSATAMALAPDGGLLAVVEGASGEIVLVDCASRSIAGRVHTGGDISALVFTPDGKVLAASDRARAQVIFINVSARKVLGDVGVGKAPGSLAMLPDGSKLFVADTGEPKVSAIDVASRQLLSNIEIGSNPDQVLLKPDGGELFVLSRTSAILTILDAFHDDVDDEMAAGEGSVAAVATKDSSRLFVLNSGALGAGGSVEAVDVNNRSLPSSVVSTPVGRSPVALALTPDERFLAVADPGSSSLGVLGTSVLNPKSKPNGTPLPLITMIPVGAHPVAVAIPGWLAY
jgi:YVTN family beta-propeller protein